MKFLLVHLSDIHLTVNNNSFLEKSEALYKAFQNIAHEMERIIIVITGDIVYSGKSEEYNIAMKVIDDLIGKTKSYTKKTVDIILIPGNHDCNFDIQTVSVRDILINNIRQTKVPNITDDIIEQCCEVQKDYFEFSDCYYTKNNQVYSDKLLKILEYKIGDYTIIFNCFNTSWMSQKHEQYGLHYPISKYKDKLINTNNDFTISLLHHTYNWYNHHYRELRDTIEECSDVVITGHEHVSTMHIKYDLKEQFTEYIEGAVLQDIEDQSSSAFNILVVDLENKMHKILSYKWEKNLYTLKTDIDWFYYKNNCNRLNINEEFEIYLNDPGAIFTHPNKNNLLLDDFYIFPDLTDMKKRNSTDEKKKIIKGRTLTEFLSPFKILVLGSEKSGKTALCKKLYEYYYKKGIIPLLIDGREIKSTSTEDFEKLINCIYLNQYSSSQLAKYMQLENDKKLIIIDNLDKSRLNSKHRNVLISRISNKYKNLLITATDLLEYQIVDNEDFDNTIKDFDYYKINEFGYLLRDELINKWYEIGFEQFITEDELTRKNLNATNTINTIIGKGLVPAYPIFLLLILQSIETGNYNTLKESSYGYYYSMLITNSLSRIELKVDELDGYYNYISELAYYLFNNKISEIPYLHFVEFHKWLCCEYKITPSLEKYIENLIKASILEKKQNSFKFKYRYIYYYFAAKYFADNITREEIKEKITEMCKRLYRQEFANIIMFLCHLSKDPFIIEQVLGNAKIIFNDTTPITLLNDTQLINELIERIPGLILEDKDSKKRKKETLRLQDKMEANEESIKNDHEYDLTEDISNNDMFAQLNQSFKTIEIMGQILKNHYGSLKGIVKIPLYEEACLLGFRTLNVICKHLENNIDGIVREIQEYISNKRNIGENKTEKISRELAFHIYSLIFYSIIKRISECIGSANLYEIHNDVLNRINTIAMKLVDTSIVLDSFGISPIDNLRERKKDTEGNLLSFVILRYLGLYYLYMFPVGFKDKQTICSLLNVSLKNQRMLKGKEIQKKINAHNKE